MIPLSDGFILCWSKEHTGFGEINFMQDEDGKWRVDTEYMSVDFVKEMMNDFIDHCEMKE
jgi:hypothetical protein